MQFFKTATVLATMTLAGVTGAKAGPIIFVGTADGSFNGSGATLGGLTYAAGAFSGQSSSGYLSIGGTSSNFGALSLAGGTFDYDGNSFDLSITFTAPDGTAGGQDFTANLLGSVTNSNGGVQIAFSNPTQTFTVAGADGDGTFSLHVNSLSVFVGGTGYLNGYILSNIVAPVPEPLTLSLFGAGLAGAMAMRRRKVAA